MNAYLVLDISIHNLTSFNEYIQKTPEYIEKHSGKYVVQGVEPVIKEGNWNPERIVIIESPSKDNANSFLNDPKAQCYSR